jgi:SAM-dependent methyltransferase
MIETISHGGNQYPRFQSEGFAAQFAIPFALKICHGEGYDIGCNRPQWCLPGAYGIDPAINGTYDAMHLPDKQVDYIFSSHCLEHLDNWVDALDYWATKIRKGGVLFLYLPDYSQSYWRPWWNRKHIHIFSPDIIRQYLNDLGWKNVFVSGIDLNNSFIAIAEKA